MPNTPNLKDGKKYSKTIRFSIKKWVGRKNFLKPAALIALIEGGVWL